MEYTLKDIEIILLNESSKHFLSDDFKGLLDEETLSILNNTVNGGELHSIFNTLVVKELTHIALENSDNEMEKVENNLEERVKEYLSSAPSEEERTLRHLIILFVAVANLKVFVEHNWVGPPLQSSMIWPDCPDMLKKSDDLLKPQLMTDGEDVNIIASNLAHFFIARFLLTRFEGILAAHCKTSKFWLIRCLWIQQFLYEERLPSLKERIMRLIEDEETSNDLFREGGSNDDDITKSSFIQFHLESCHILYFYYESNSAQEHIEKVKQVTGLEVNLTGVLGKRTRFQQSSLPQLILQVERLDHHGDQNGFVSHPRDPVLPKNLGLDDDAVLDKMQLENPEEVNGTRLSPLEQCFILGLCYHHRRNKEGHGSVIKEETMAYLNCILSQPVSWCVETMALYTRCRWEYDGTRYMHRSLSQLEELSNQYRKPSINPINRLSWVFSSILPPHWTIQHELGEMLDNMGLTKSALEVFERLQMWDDVIRCHAALSNNNKAETLIREQLAIKETPLLWCYLGEVTKDETCFHKAWELSGQRFAKSQRMLAFWHMRKGEFEKSLEYFERCLSINPLQIGVWFSYGCASMSCSRFDKAANGFRRTVNLNNDNFEAWTNLAVAYINAKNKPRAFIALQEALKCNYENWKIWENYLVVSLDIGQFEETLKAFHRLIDLKQKYNDVQVLSVLTKAICNNTKDATGQDGLRLKPKLLKLLGHITSKVTNDADVWRLYAQAAGQVSDGQILDESSCEKVLQYLQKSHRCCTSLTPNWDKNPEKCLDVCIRTASLAEAYKSYLSVVNEEDQKSRIISSAKLAINGVIVAVKRNKIDFLAGQTLDNLDKSLVDLEKWLEDILNLKS